jgi:acyl-CoA synthetase (AMP-forming)/AMP-acid ligase II
VNVAELLSKAARTYSLRPALRLGTRTFTYGELDEVCGRVAAGLLASGLHRGDRVVVWMPNRLELVISMLAGFRAGLFVVPVNARLHPSEVGYIIDNSEAAALIHDEGLAGQVEGWLEGLPGRLRRFPAGALPTSASGLPPVEMDPDDHAWLFYTSGTTGRPKGAVLTHRNLVAAAMNCLADLYSFQPEDVVLHAAPLTHGCGVYMLPALARGAFNVVTEGHFDPARVFATIASERVTAVSFLAPTQIVALLEHSEARGADLSTVRAVIYGGGPMYVEHILRALELWGPVWIQLFGQGESPMTGTYLRREDHMGSGPDRLRRLGSIGIPRTDMELQIADAEDGPVADGEIGELLLRGPTVMKGYWRNEEATTQALRGGWLHTGDVGYQDPDGYVHLVDRAKDMIVSGGNNVYAREVEEVLLTHPAVVEVAVIGVPDSYWGEAVHAYVVRRAGFDLGDSELIQHCRARLASYKKPRSIEFVEELPKNAYGKVLKRELRERHWTGHERLIGGGGPAAGAERASKT